MFNDPLVSIIIPVFNGTNYMREAIDSALNQTYKNCEVLVINDGSNDNDATEKVALSYGDRIKYYKKENGGVATAVNFGIDHMNGEYFAWLSHDDMFYPDKIENQMTAIKRSGNPYAICHGNFDSLEMETRKKTSINLLDIYTKEQLQDGCFAPIFLAIHGSTVLFHRDHFDRVGKYRTDLKATQDSEFLFRVMRGQKSVFVEKPLIIGRLHPEQGQKTMACHRVEYNEMFKFFCEELSDEEKCEMCGSVANFYYRLFELLDSSKPADTIIGYLKEKIDQYYDVDADTMSARKKIIDDYLNSIIPKDLEIYLFGGGYYGKVMARKLNSYGLTPNAIIDNDRKKHGNLIEGILCCGLEDIKMSVDKMLVIIAVSGDVKDIRNQLEAFGVKHILTYREMDQVLFKILPPRCR